MDDPDLARLSWCAVFKGLPHPVVRIDALGGVVDGNAAWWALAGAESNAYAALFSFDRSTRAAQVRRVANGDDPRCAFDLALDDLAYRVEVQAVAGGAVLMLVDISDLKLREWEANRRAETDELTGLLNRRAFACKVESALPHLLSAGDATVLMIDLDAFKKVNDTYGHAVGDRLLTLVAKRLENSLRKGDLIARWGGDEFVALLPDTDASEAAVVRRHCLASLQIPFQIETVRLAISASFGHASLPRDAGDLDEALALADARMYGTKGSTPSAGRSAAAISE